MLKFRVFALMAEAVRLHAEIPMHFYRAHGADSAREFLSAKLRERIIKR